MKAGDEGFRKHEAEQLRAWAALTPLQRLRWLVQAKEFSRRWLGAAAKPPDRPPPKS